MQVPDPLQTVFTRWGSDPFSLGSYSHVAVGASGCDDLVKNPLKEDLEAANIKT